VWLHRWPCEYFLFQTLRVLFWGRFAQGPKWGTPEARMREMLRLQSQIDAVKKGKKG
jgi:hypothetical protein